MKALKIEVGYGETVNMGNYESVRVDYRMQVELTEGEKPTDVIEVTRDFLQERLTADKKAIIAKRG